VIDRIFKCDLCRDRINDPHNNAVGLKFTTDRDWLVEVDPMHDCERHLCVKCLSALGKFKPICGGGIRGCTGGPKCGSDHK
jgi:hypothetical protein